MASSLMGSTGLYESVNVVVGENWLLRHKAEMVCHEKDFSSVLPRRRMGLLWFKYKEVKPISREKGSCPFVVFRNGAKALEYCRSCKVRVGSNGNLLWEASILLGRKKGMSSKNYFWDNCGNGQLKFTAMPFGLTMHQRFS
ncbi:hypothetical protein Tco_0564263 [Tanacetum coccineum]